MSTLVDTSLLGKLLQVFEYIGEAVEADGSNRAVVLAKQAQHLTAIIRRDTGKLAIGDVTAALKLLKSPICPFDAIQSKDMRAAIDAAGAPDADASGAAVTFRKHTKCQEFVAIEHYLTSQRWDVILDPDTVIETIIEVVSNVCHEIGCDHPSPKPSQMWMTAFIHAVNGRLFSPDEAYVTLRKFREQIHHQRRQSKPGSPSGILKFDATGALFAQTYPAAFPFAPPVQSQIPRELIEQALGKVCCRDTNDRLTVPKITRSKTLDTDAFQCYKSGPRGQMVDANDPAALMRGMMQFASLCMQGGAQGCTDGEVNMTFPGRSEMKDPHSRKRKLLLGNEIVFPARVHTPALLSPLADTPAVAASIDQGNVPADVVTNGGVAGLDVMIAATGKTSKVTKCTPKAKAKAKATTGKGKTKAKPKATPKADGKEETVDTYDKDKPPKMPNIGEPRAPFVVGKSKVYTCPSSKSWRVKPVPTKSDNDIVFKWKDDPKKAWQDVIKLCKTPKIPSHWKLKL